MKAGGDFEQYVEANGKMALALILDHPDISAANPAIFFVAQAYFARWQARNGNLDAYSKLPSPGMAAQSFYDVDTELIPAMQKADKAEDYGAAAQIRMEMFAPGTDGQMPGTNENTKVFFPDSGPLGVGQDPAVPHELPPGSDVSHAGSWGPSYPELGPQGIESLQRQISQQLTAYPETTSGFPVNSDRLWAELALAGTDPFQLSSNGPGTGLSRW